MMRIFLTLLFTWNLAAGAAQAQVFRFSDEESRDQAQEGAQPDKVQTMLQTPCLAKIKNQKIMVLIGETRNGTVLASQAAFSPHVDAVNSRLKALGLKTYTAGQIRQQVAQAELDAYFKNDPDTALGASKRLGAQYVLRGLIATQTSRNPALQVNQVNIHMDFALTAANGRVISQASAEHASYAGQDTAGMALTLINERADELVARLYSDHCRQARAR